MDLFHNFSRVGLGTSNIASLGKRITKEQASILFTEALNSNVRVIDTADTYGSGDSERLIANAIKGKRDDFFIITKAGLPYMSLPEFASPLNQVGKKVYQQLGFKKKYSSDYLVTSLKKSLVRLNTNYVNTFFLHEPEKHDLVIYDDFWKGLEKIKKEGLAQNVGIATNDVEAFNLAFKAGVVDLLETAMPYNHKETTLFVQCKNNNIPVIVNQIMRAKDSLSMSEGMILKLTNRGLSIKDIPSILVAYAINYKKADCVLIGTHSSIHLKENANAPSYFHDLDSIFAEIEKNVL